MTQNIMADNYYEIDELVDLLTNSSFSVLKESFENKIKIPEGVEKFGEIATAYGVILSDDKPDVTVRLRVPVLVDITKGIEKNKEMAEDYGLSNEVWANMFSAIKIISNGESNGTLKIKVNKGTLIGSERAIESGDFHLINPASIYMYPEKLKGKTIKDYDTEIPNLIISLIRGQSLIKVYDYFIKPNVKEYEQVYDEKVVDCIFKNYNIDAYGNFRNLSNQYKYKKSGYLHRVSGFSSLPTGKIVMQRIIDKKEPTTNMTFMYEEMKRILDLESEEERIEKAELCKLEAETIHQRNKDRLRKIKYQLISEGKAEPAEFQYNYMGKDYTINIALEKG